MLDTSVFKKLAHNDTGAASGHQGGIVVPKDIAEFFPPLSADTSGTEPTVDARLTADLFVDEIRVATVQTRYQHQTWGGTRSPERRLTDNLGPLRNEAVAGDIVLFTKDLSDDGYIQIHLLKQGTPEYLKIDRIAGPLRWGIADPDNPPVSLSDIREAEKYINARATGTPAAFADGRPSVEVTALRKARNRSFRRHLLNEYDFRCAFSGRRYASPVSPGTVGLDAAHIIPIHANGSDHPGNGLPLSKDLHWAFDRGLLSVAKDRSIVVPDSVASIQGNEYLRSLAGNPLREAVTHSLRALDEALEWHRLNVLLK